MRPAVSTSSSGPVEEAALRLSSIVKRHSKLTPWRHRKLTPEETAYAPEVERGDVPSVS